MDKRAERGGSAASVHNPSLGLVLKSLPRTSLMDVDWTKANVDS